METTMKHGSINATVSHSKTETESVSSFWKMVEFNRYGIIAMLVIVIGCLGGIAAGVSANFEPFKIAVVAFPTSIALALILAVAPMKAIIYTCALAVLCDILLFII